MRKNYPVNKRTSRVEEKLKDPRFDWRTIFLKNSGGISSKRVCGLIGFTICIAIYIAGFVLDKDIPVYGETVIIVSSSLLGIDCITSSWSRNVNTGSE